MSDEREEIFMGVSSAERSTTEKMRVLARFLLHSIAVRGLEPFLAVPSFADRQAGRAEDFGMCLVGDFEMRVTFRKVLSYSKGGDVARRYVLICAIFSLAVSLIRENRTCSLRDVFYFLKHMFKNQQESNRRIYDLGLLLNMTRSEMGFVPATSGEFDPEITTNPNITVLIQIPRTSGWRPQVSYRFCSQWPRQLY